MHYCKPELLITKFVLNNSINACGDTYTGSVTLNCVIQGTHDLFYTAAYCDSDSLYGNMCIVTDSDGCRYLVWLENGSLNSSYSETVDYKLDDYSGNELIRKLGSIIGVTGTGNYLHASKITDNVESVINLSN